jgi:bifunctional aspartokinase / homoserine dehydrogenase 1
LSTEHPHMRRQVSEIVKTPLRIMKFGGTSVGDAPSIRKVLEIVRAASRESEVVVVVSALSEVTNQFVDAATQSETGNRGSVEMIFQELRNRHHTMVCDLIRSVPERRRINQELEEVFQEGERLCQNTATLQVLTPRARDSISSLGERLSAPLIAAALTEWNVASQAIAATQLIETDSCHGSAEPKMDPTRAKCELRLRPLLQNGIVPVVTGFIGATSEGVLTTLGRGGSDYSATIVGAALGADEVTIWTDVDGLMTADPHMVPGASTIPEISYREAAELARFGAKVLHPKTLSALAECGMPLWIRNTFAPDRPGTRITPGGPLTDGEVKGITAISDVALITVSDAKIVSLPEVLAHIVATTAAVPANVLLIAQSSEQNEIHLVIASAVAERTLRALRREFTLDQEHEKIRHITLDPTVALVTIVGKKLQAATLGRGLNALSCQNLNVIAVGQGSSDCSISFVVSKHDTRAALDKTHQEFRLGAIESRPLPIQSVGFDEPAWRPGPVQRTAGAD